MGHEQPKGYWRCLVCTANNEPWDEECIHCTEDDEHLMTARNWAIGAVDVPDQDRVFYINLLIEKGEMIPEEIAEETRKETARRRADEKRTKKEKVKSERKVVYQKGLAELDKQMAELLKDVPL
jgi:hypothetical protein